jgi:hypothetical protein
LVKVKPGVPIKKPGVCKTNVVDFSFNHSGSEGSSVDDVVISRYMRHMGNKISPCVACVCIKRYIIKQDKRFEGRRHPD